MDIQTTDDAVTRRIKFFTDREMRLRANDLYFYNQPVEEIKGGARVIVNGREMGMYASYSYLGLIGHPRINAAAKAAIDKFGTGTNGVRLLAGTLTIHTELEETIAAFKHAEAAITYSSGYSTNLTVISTLMGSGKQARLQIGPFAHFADERAGQDLGLVVTLAWQSQA